MRKLTAIAGNNLRRLFRERSNIFFVFVLPLLLIVVIGIVFGGGFTPRIGVVAPAGEPFADELVAALEAVPGIALKPVDDRAGIELRLERGDLEAGIVIPAGYDAALRSGAGVEITYLSGATTGGFEIASLIGAEVAKQSARIRAAHFASTATGSDFATALAAARAAEPLVAGVAVTVTGEASGTALGQFDLGAAQQLVLFMFVTALAGSAALIQSRRLGVSRRMLSTPTGAWTVVTGETLGRFTVVMVQGLFIIVVAALAFNVKWGDPLAAGALTIAFALVGTGAGMLMGSLFENDAQAGGIGTFLALAFGALGGCMAPLEIFSDTMVRIAHATPHAWALDGFSETIRRGGGLGDVVTELAVLVGFAAVLLLGAGWIFRRRLTHG